MSKSPLSGAFSEAQAPAKKKKKGGAILIISGVALATSLGGVFAANTISVNNGDSLEFGQGVAATNSCTDAINTALSQAYDATVSGEFKVTDLEIQAKSTAGVVRDFTTCSGKTLNFSLLNASGSAVWSNTLGVVASGATGNQVNTTATNFVYRGITGSGSASIPAGDVKKVTVTTSN